LVTIPSLTFGDIEIDERTIYTFPKGIPGLRDIKRYAIVESEDMAPFRWLLACDAPYLSLMLIDPKLLDPAYEVQVTREHLQLIGEGSVDELFLMSLVVTPKDPRQMTANLLAPLLFNAKTRQAMQVVLEGAHDELLRVKVLKD